jgi:hypothetical protein
MPVSTSVRDANGEIEILLYESNGRIVSRKGDFYTDEIGVNGCNEVLNSLHKKTFDSQADLEKHIEIFVSRQKPVVQTACSSLQKPLARTACSLVDDWSTYSIATQVVYMLRNMKLSVDNSVVLQDESSMLDLWSETGFNLDLQWDHDKYRWVEMSP